jgi:hypothetical protein
LPATDRREETLGDEIDLCFAKLWPQIPTMEIRTADRRPHLEVRSQSRVDSAQWVNVIT